MKIKEKVLKEVLKEYSMILVQKEEKSTAIGKAIDLTLAEVSKCSVCKKKKPFELMSIECLDCYLKGIEKEGFISKEEVVKEIEEVWLKHRREDKCKVPCDICIRFTILKKRFEVK